jgi:glycerol uptake facilitator-like aquaporin
VSSKLAAEPSGTFWLVLGGCGSAVLAAAFPEVGIGLLGVALAFGLTVLTGACAGRAPKPRGERQALAAVYRLGGRRRT